MAATYLIPGLRYQIIKDDFANVEVFEIKKRQFLDYLEVQNLVTGITQTIKESVLIELLYKDKLQFEVQGKNTKKPEYGKLKTDFNWQDFSQIKEKRRLPTYGRYLMVKEFIKLSHTMTNKEAHPLAVERGLKLLKEERNFLMKKPELSTLESWCRVFIDSGCDIRSLVPGYDNSGGPGTTRRSRRMDALIKQAFDTIHLRVGGGSIKEVHAALTVLVKKENEFGNEDDKQKVPSLRSLYDWIDRQKEKDILRKKFGKRMAKKANRSTGAGVKITRPLERGEIDDTPLDIFLVDEEDRMPIGRPYLTFNIDHFSGYPLGFYLGFDSPSEATAMECLLHSIEPKTYVKDIKSVKNEWNAYGVVDEIARDWGKPYQAKAFNDACAQIGIDPVDCPVRTPNFKGKIERFFRTINQGLLTGLPGVILDDVVDKQDYDPAKNAVLGIQAFWELLHIFVVDLYTQNWHDGVDFHGVPQKIWDNGMVDNPRRYPPNTAELKILLSHSENRELLHYGVDLWTIRYNDPYNADLAEVRALQKQAKARNDKNVPDQFLIKVHKWDLSQIWLHDHFNNRYIRMPAIDQEYTKGLSYYKHQFVLQYRNKQKKDDVDQMSLAEARQRVQKIVKKEYSKTRIQRTRKKLHSILGPSISPYRFKDDGDESMSVDVHQPEQCTAGTFGGISDFSKSCKQKGDGGGDNCTKPDPGEEEEDSKEQRTIKTPKIQAIYSKARLP
jgi:putative transposase